MKKLGKLVVIDGASASGKSTIINALLEQNTIKFELIKRFVSRAPHGPDDDYDLYEFITYDTFQKFIRSGLLAEYYCYKFKMCYGVSIDRISNKLAEGKNCITMINLGNYKMIKQHFPDAIGFFLNVSLSTIEQRIRSRTRHTEEQIVERIENASRMKEFMKDYDYVIDNESHNPNQVVQQILNILTNKFQ